MICALFYKDLNSICLPIDKHLFEEISPALTMNNIEQQIGNIKKTMHIIVLAAILSFILGYAIHKLRSFTFISNIVLFTFLIRGVFFGFLG